MSVVKFSFVSVALYMFLVNIQAASIKNYVLDENCPLDLIIYDIRVTDCDELPCTIKRGKRYFIEGDFGVLRNTSEIVLKCSTVYLGRHVELPGHGGCSNLVNASCPVTVGQRYTTTTSFRIPYYVPPMTYTVYCSMVDDRDENMMCGWGSGDVV